MTLTPTNNPRTDKPNKPEVGSSAEGLNLVEIAPTPFVLLEHLSTADKTLYGKMESTTPTGSLKDRMVTYSLEAMLAEGTIDETTTIVEASSGNTGIALSKACQIIGLPCVICVADHISETKKQLIRDNGAEVREFDVRVNTEAEIEAAAALGTQEGIHFFNQFENPYHMEAYKQTLGKELLRNLQVAGVTIDYLVAGIGTGASIRAIGELLREQHNPDLKVYGVSPDSHPTQIEGLHPGQLRGDFAIWKDREPGFEEDRIFVSDAEAVEGRASLMKREGHSLGYCSGALLDVALHKIEEKGNFLLLLSDSGDRYAPVE